MGLYWVEGTGLSGFGFWVSGFGFRFSGSEYRVQAAIFGYAERGSGHLYILKGRRCSGSGAGSYLRLIDVCITQLKAQGPSRTCNERKEEEEAHRSWFRL